ncbi:MAG: histidine kinase dimerization/phosphoacceptor domain -containing protein [Candidatus Magnetobacterium sp. LHC-1]|nr:response regulator [Nitrospirota bacterium]
MLNDTVLVIDDNAITLREVCDTLSGDGYQTLTATGVMEGLEGFEQHRPALVLMDIGLMDIGGLDFIRLLKKHYHGDVSFVVLTDGHNAGMLKTLSDLDVCSFLRKPLDPYELRGAVKLNFAMRTRRDSTDRQQPPETKLCTIGDITVLQKAVDIMQIGVMIIDDRMRIQYVNVAQAAIFGITPGQMRGRALDEFLPNQYCVISDEKRHKTEQLVFAGSGYTHLQLISDMVIDEADRPVAFIYCCMDITDLKEMEKQIFKDNYELEDIVRDRTRQLEQANKQLTASLKDKMLLLKELHHRVNNNLQIISSMLSLSSDHITDPQLLTIFKSSYTRIRAMSLMHGKLYNSPDLSTINPQEYISELVGELLSSYKLYYSSPDIDIEVDTDDLDINLMLPCALIINELISNALRHAFAKDQKGRILIVFKRNNDDFTLSISDDGIGLDREQALKKQSYTGLQLVNDLVRSKLKGVMDIDTGKGTKFTISFKEGQSRYHNKV